MSHAAEEAATAPLIHATGIYEVEESTYHADAALAPELGRSISVSGAKKILASPARFAYERDHGQPPREAFDWGHAVHADILGIGADVAVIVADDWRSKAAREARDEARAAGKTPMLEADHAKVKAAADAVRAHPTAGAIFQVGQPERSMYWIDDTTGVTCRGRIDWWHNIATVDLKSAADASPEGFAKAAANYGYDMQAWFYQWGRQALTEESLPFIFVVVEKEPPHLVGVYQLDPAALARGERRCREALDIYVEHESNDSWPTSYGTEIQTLSLPRWAN